MKFINKDICEIKKEQGYALCTNGWQGPKMDRIQRPFPNKETFRYKSVFEFPSTCLDRKTRPVDDFMPREQIKKFKVVLRRKFRIFFSGFSCVNFLFRP